MNKKLINNEQIMNLLDTCYDKVLTGIPNGKDCYALAEEYLQKHNTPEKAAYEFTKWQVTKCTTSGFITSLGGIITLPVAVPANLISVWYVQLRMITTLAILGGHDPSEDSIQTLAYVCLAGSSITKICREAGIQFTNKLTISMIKKIPGTLLTKINQKIGFRFITKFGTTGVINLGKMVPIAGGVFGGAIDFVETKMIAKKAYNLFILNEVD